jgi:hypothetical protein
MTLCYVSYPLIDTDKVPRWIASFAAHPLVQQESWGIYDPGLGFAGNMQNPRCLVPLSESHRISERATRNREALRLDPALFAPLTRESMRRIEAADAGPSVDIPFKHLYALLRSDVVLADLDEPNHGESHEVLYAYLLGVPVVGIANRFILSPWVTEKCNVVVFNDNADAIVRQVLAHDRKVTAVLRRADEEATRTQKIADTLAKLNALRQTTEAQEPDGVGKL